MEPEICKTEPWRPVSSHFSCFLPDSGLLRPVNCAHWTLWMSHIGTLDIVDVSYWHIVHLQCGHPTVSLWITHSVSVAHTQCLCGTHTQCLSVGHTQKPRGPEAGPEAADSRESLSPLDSTLPPQTHTHPKSLPRRCGGTTSLHYH